MFTKSPISESFEVKVVESRDLVEKIERLWERDLVKHIKSEVRLERFFESASGGL